MIFGLCKRCCLWLFNLFLLVFKCSLSILLRARTSFATYIRLTCLSECMCVHRVHFLSFRFLLHLRIYTHRLLFIIKLLKSGSQSLARNARFISKSEIRGISITSSFFLHFFHSSLQTSGKRLENVNRLRHHKFIVQKIKGKQLNNTLNWICEKVYSTCYITSDAWRRWIGTPNPNQVCHQFCLCFFLNWFLSVFELLICAYFLIKLPCLLRFEYNFGEFEFYDFGWIERRNINTYDKISLPSRRLWIRCVQK